MERPRASPHGVVDKRWTSPYSAVSVPVMLGWTSHQNVYEPAASAGTAFVTFLDDTTSPLKSVAPAASLMAILCGAASWLSRTISVGVSALIVSDVGWNARSLATTTISPLAGADAPGLDGATVAGAAGGVPPEQATVRG